jgi:hypothetical protein
MDTENKKGLARKLSPRLAGSPNGNRTRVFGVRGRYPRPLDDGTSWLGDEDSNLGLQGQNLPSCH